MNDKKIIICGYFSLPYKTCTAGDLLVLNTLTKWFDSLGFKYDIVADSLLGIEHTINDEDFDISKYYSMVFLCGPIFDIDSLYNYILKFNGIKRIAVNVSVINKNDRILQLFDYIFPRDTPDYTCLDMSFEEIIKERVPVVGLIYVGAQIEYPDQMHDKVEKIVDNVLADLNFAKILIDTKLPYNNYNLNNLTQIISVISKMDLVITTRLHGSILSFKAHVPFITIDPVPSCGKVYKQINKIGWPYLLKVTNLTENSLKTLIISAMEKSNDRLFEMSENNVDYNYSLQKEIRLKEIEGVLK